MQQRKAKMSAAIMGSAASTTKPTAKETKEVLETAVNRFLQSPKVVVTTQRSSAGTKENVSNTDVIEIL
jgi:hypothetical protein